MLVDCLPEETIRQVLSSGDFPHAGNFALLGQAHPVPGGYSVSGRWPFMSGCQNARWLIVGAVVVEEEKPGSTRMTVLSPCS
jgi:alkylation response protein AidB-like acyl-CoA dehydrogenase